MLEIKAVESGVISQPPIPPSVTVHAITTIGIAAYDQLQVDACGFVVAVFKRCLYIELGSGVMCLGLRSIEPGPLTIQLACCSADEVASIAVGDFAYTRSGLLTIQNGLTIDSTSANLFSRCAKNVISAKVAIAGTTDAVNAAVENPGAGAGAGAGAGLDVGAAPGTHFRKLIDSQLLRSAVLLQNGGFHWVITKALSSDKSPSAPTALEHYATPALTYLALWLRQSDRLGVVPPCPVEVCRVLGAGPGLTPSGDDFLAGVLLTLRQLGFILQVDALWAVLNPALELSTHKISAALLVQARAGHASERIHTVLDAVLSENQLDVPMITGSISYVGATSGWDTFAGMVFVLQHTLND